MCSRVSLRLGLTRDGEAPSSGAAGPPPYYEVCRTTIAADASSVDAECLPAGAVAWGLGPAV